MKCLFALTIKVTLSKCEKQHETPFLGQPAYILQAERTRIYLLTSEGMAVVFESRYLRVESVRP